MTTHSSHLGRNETTTKEKGKSFFGASRVSGDIPFFQRRLKVGPVDDHYEREADAVADQVMSAGVGGKVNTMISGVDVQRKCSKCEEEEKVQRKETNAEDQGQGSLDTVAQALGSSGQSLDKSTKSFMEQRFGHDFSDVKIHTNSIAAKSASSINALAYTSGSSIVFSDGQYAPGTTSGNKLLAHELTHVVQQKGGAASGKIQRQSPPFSSPTSCNGLVASRTYSRGNDDWAECSYETARITVELMMDPCACSGGFDMPLSIHYSALLEGKNFTGRTVPNPSGTGTMQQREGQASHIATGVATPGRSTAGPTQPGMTLSEVVAPGATPNVTGPLSLSVDDARTGGRPGDPGDTVSQTINLGTVNCAGASRGGTVNVGGGFQVIDYQITADSTGVQAASISLTERGRMAGRIFTPLIDLTAGGTAYPVFPGTTRPGATGACSCDATTGVQRGGGCARGSGSAGFGRP